MKVCCEYCGQYFPETEERCPHCGAPNNVLTRSGRAVPRTIEELKLFCASHNLPLEQMRFYIGENYRGARAFGVFKDDHGVCTVYKNKSDGSRAIRYQGTDEAHAVGEIYQKLKSEIQNQRQHQAQQPVRSFSPQSGGSGVPTGRKKGRGISLGTVLIVLGIIAALCFIFNTAAKPNTGYYSYGGDQYYYQNDSWYQYDSGLGSWFLSTGVDDALQDHAGDYFESYSWSQDYGVGDFADSGYYDSHSYSDSGSGSSQSDSGRDSDWDSDWDDWSDSDWDWDSGDSWDSGWTDWDSDW